jgi:hypothetical protein
VNAEPTPPAPLQPVPPGHLDRLVVVLLMAALLRAGSTMWSVTQFHFANVDAFDRARLFARNVTMLPGLLVLLAFVFAAFWAGRVVAFTPRLVRRARILFFIVLAVATFLALAQLVGLACDLAPDPLPFEGFSTHGPAVLDEVGGVVLTLPAVASSVRRLRAVTG